MAWPFRTSMAFVAFAALVGCGSDSAPNGGGECGALDALVAMGDMSASAVGGFDVDGCTTAIQSTTDLGKDPQLAVSRGRYFYIARDGDRVFELDPSSARTAAAPLNVNDPDRAGVTNPQDLAVAADGAFFVPRFNLPSVAIFEPSGARRKNIDLSAYDSDGNPNASAIQIVDVGGVEKAFVTLGRLDDKDDFRSKQPSQILRIDVTTGQPEGTTQLEGRNPFNTMIAHEQGLWMSVPGTWDSMEEPDAGIERFDPLTNTSRLVVRERDLGGSVTNIALAPGCGAAIVADASAKNATSVTTFDPASGAVIASAGASVFSTDGFDLLAIAWKGDVLLVGDRRAGARGYTVHAFDRTGKCDLRLRTDAIFLAEPPLIIRTH